jgi:hypothetical protein
MIAALVDGLPTTSLHYPETCRRGVTALGVSKKSVRVAQHSSAVRLVYLMFGRLCLTATSSRP